TPLSFLTPSWARQLGSESKTGTSPLASLRIPGKHSGRWKETDAAAARRRRPRPRESTVLLFPGQGSQFVGMGRGLLRYPRVRRMFRVAETVLGYDLLSLCLRGPRAELDRTRHCQPAVFVASLAAVERLSHRQPNVLESCVAAAGFSVGEFAALVFAGAMDFTEVPQTLSREEACSKKN
uniref:Malonyl-CoA-acyl carrier protein transacylase n=1 Tax=Dromaius novaehollandiae TaxID=8790 RepID=A0A8C4J215_DRONO